MKSFFAVNAVSSLAETNSLSKNFTQPRAGKFCVQINGYFVRELYYELRNWRNNKVDTTGNLHKTANWIRVEFDHLQAGDYQLTFRNISEIIEFIELCPGMKINLFRIWELIFCICRE